MLDRIMGVITLKPSVYRQIADDTSATGQAATIVVIVAVITGLFNGLVRVAPDGSTSPSLIGALLGAVVTVILALIAWGVSAWILATVAGMLGGKTDTSEMLRVTGYVEVFNLVSILNVVILFSAALSCVTSILGLVVAILGIIGFVIGVREAAEFSTGRAIVAAIVAGLIEFFIIGLGTVILTFLLVALGAGR
jgi:hypothetical protein